MKYCMEKEKEKEKEKDFSYVHYTFKIFSLVRIEVSWNLLTIKSK